MLLYTLKRLFGIMVMLLLLSLFTLPCPVPFQVAHGCRAVWISHYPRTGAAIQSKVRTRQTYP